MSAYTDAVAADSPLYYWTLNTTSGDETSTGSATARDLHPASLVAQNATGGFTGSGSAWQFNSSTSSCESRTGGSQATLPALAIAQLTVEYWLKWDTNADDDALAMEYSPNFISGNGFIVDQNSSAGGVMGVGFGESGGGKNWSDNFTRPSAAAWHYYVHYLDRTTPSIKSYLEGSLVTASSTDHKAATYGSFAAAVLFPMSRGGSSLRGAGTIQHIAFYTGELLSGRVAAHYAAAVGGGQTPPYANVTITA